MSRMQSSSNNGALLDLGVLSAPKLYASKDPTFSYFSSDLLKSVARHTNFAISDIDIGFENTAALIQTDWATGTKVETQKRTLIPGDLLIGMSLNVSLTRLAVATGGGALLQPEAGTTTIFEGEEQLYLEWAEELGHAMIQTTAWRTNSNVVEMLSGVHLHDFHETRSTNNSMLQESIGRLRNSDGVQMPFTNTSLGGARLFAALDRNLHIPLPFSFLRGSPFPLCAAQRAELTFECTLRGRHELINAYYQTVDGGANVVYYPLNPQSQVTGGRINDIYLSARVVNLGPAEQGWYTCSKQTRYFEYVQNLQERAVAANTLNVDINVPFQQALTDLCVAYRDNAALSALSGPFVLNTTTRPVGQGLAEAPRLEYFNFSTPVPPALLPARLNAAHAPLTGSSAPAVLGFYQCPLDRIIYLLNGTVRSDRTGIWNKEIDTYTNGALRIEPNNYITRVSFNRDPLRTEMSSGASFPGASNLTSVQLTFVRNNVSQSGIVGTGVLFMWARTQNYYVLVENQMGLEWPSNTVF
jgi:hypothetical protein